MHAEEIERAKLSISLAIVSVCEGKTGCEMGEWKLFYAVFRSLSQGLENCPASSAVERRKVRDALVWCCKRVYGMYRDIFVPEILLNLADSGGSDAEYRLALCWLRMGHVSRYQHLAMDSCPPGAARDPAKRAGTERLWMRVVRHYGDAIELNCAAAHTALAAFIAYNGGFYLTALCFATRGAGLALRDPHSKRTISNKAALDFLVICSTKACEKISLFSGLAGAIACSKPAVVNWELLYTNDSDVSSNEWQLMYLLYRATESLLHSYPLLLPELRELFRIVSIRLFTFQGFLRSAANVRATALTGDLEFTDLVKQLLEGTVCI